MAPTEAKILNNYLLLPAQLPAIISLDEFIALFPRSLQSSPHIRSLYRDLQSQRNAVVDSVADEIEAEVKQGKAIRRAARRAKHDAEARDFDEEVEIEKMISGSAPGAQNLKYTLETIVPDLESAVGKLEGELQRLEQQEAALMESVQQTVGNLSDLRYGRLGNNQLRDQVLDGLANLEATCTADN
ncbi:Cnl2/NKP2 family protein-domain-containing protein [Echria macrotheca]|uniref:Cnl2/NKP2 family protein-domain-containing protein n=1 Tax=Echria macrotheca TaxID=438768 RepID=A0AAJ0BB65_9PEZI|nr:Cnl2/NKP2 family protein-domain-containing protein [Echria macrotheca]